MTSLQRIMHCFPLLLVSLLALGGCQSSSMPGAAGGSESPSAQPGFGSFLPRPSELAAASAAGRRASYNLYDLIEAGNYYNTAYPYRHVEKVSNTARFTPQYAPATGMVPANLAYCTYDFWLNDYEEEHCVGYGWSDPPGDIGAAWVGLSDFERDRWAWFQCNAAGYNSVPRLKHYFAGDSLLLAIIVVADSGESSLRYFRLGNKTIEASVYASPNNGFAPFTVSCNAGASTTGLGSITQYEWDWNSDGTYDDNTGNTATAQHSYNSAGQHTATVRVTNSYGEQDTASDTIDALAPWTRSWGTGKQDVVNAVVRDNDFSVYAVGFTDTDTDLEDLLLLKFNRNGGLVWAKSWGGPAADIGKDIFLSSEGKLYITGQTASFGAGSHDVLLQCWSTDGNLQWSRSWGGAEREEGRNVDIADDMVYVLGITESVPFTNRDVLLLKYNLNGVFQWARTLGTSNIEEGYGLDAVYNHMSHLTTIHLTGGAEDDSQIVFDLLYARFSPDGSCSDISLWMGDRTNIGRCISVSGMWSDEIFIAGTSGESSGTNVLFLEYAGGGSGLAKSWGGSAEDAAYEMMLSAGSYYISGMSKSFGGTDALLLNLSPEGAVQSAEVWDRAGSNERLYALSWYTSNGLVTGGIGSGATGGAWSNVVGSISDASGGWNDESAAFTVTEPAGSGGTPNAPVMNISGGVIDTGGGDQDALLMVRPF